MVDEIIKLILMAKAYRVLQPDKSRGEGLGIPAYFGMSINRYTSMRMEDGEVIFSPGNDGMVLGRGISGHEK